VPQAFLVSTGIVALAEIGDKTQLLALLLAAAFRRPAPIIAGILLATLANHALAGALGQWLARALGPEMMRWVLGVSFIAMGAWALIPDKLEGGAKRYGGLGAFGTTLIAFFLVEIGDKTQIATVALAARFEAFAPVVLGTTLGMMIANVPVVYIGNFAAERLPLRAIRIVAAATFVLMGAAVLAGVSIGL
jgi:putative Ca2+/H+ antiporter (TMEM165/GDT1 family)